MSHVIDVPDIIWDWAQRKSGKTNPASWIRENCLYTTMIEDIAETTSMDCAMGESVEERWAAMGMELSPLDSEFTEARTLFVDKAGGDDNAIKFLSRPSIKEPRGWLMDWWRKQ